MCRFCGERGGRCVVVGEKRGGERKGGEGGSFRDGFWGFNISFGLVFIVFRGC